MQLAQLQPQPAGRRSGRAVPAAGPGDRHRAGSRPAAARNRGRPRPGAADPGQPAQQLRIEALAGISAGAAIDGAHPLAAQSRKPAQAEITVSDNGPGFREDILGRAFEPYVTSKARGTGLGLAIVQRIVEEHGGRISAENLAAGGARVRVLLPATVRQAHGVAEGASMSASRILVVDDEADIRRAAAGDPQRGRPRRGRGRRRRAGARRARTQPHPDLVLLDIWMPDTDGITLLREWSNDARHDCPVVMMSGPRHGRDRGRGHAPRRLRFHREAAVARQAAAHRQARARCAPYAPIRRLQPRARNWRRSTDAAAWPSSCAASCCAWPPIRRRCC